MYNLLVGLNGNFVDESRVFEFTDSSIREHFQLPDGRLDVPSLLALPAIMMPEMQDTSHPNVARVGRVTSLMRVPGGYNFEFVEDPDETPIPMHELAAVARSLGIHEWEFNRTHWAVKTADLFRYLRKIASSAGLKPKVFNLPVNVPQEQDLVAVMMPFDSRFDSVYRTIQTSAHSAGMRCLRADEVWEQDKIFDDVIGLIWKSKVVITDFTDKNPNVFYEAGIAHCLGKDTIPITQNIGDIPFDLGQLRAEIYSTDALGLQKLSANLAARLDTILKR